jgi:hypothetical protein
MLPHYIESGSAPVLWFWSHFLRKNAWPLFRKMPSLGGDLRGAFDNDQMELLGRLLIDWATPAFADGVLA